MTTSPPFHASSVKLKRARHHLKELERLVIEYIASDPVKHEVLDGPGISVHTSWQGPPEEIGATVGDLLHNLRAALDLMACDLVRLNGLNANGVHFPFSETPKDLPEMIKRRKFFRAGPEAVELLKKMRPYRGGQEALRAIHDLDIQDKHKELIPQFLSFVGPMIKMERVQGQREVKLTVLRDTLNKTEVKVVFPPGSVLEGKELVPTLHDLVELTVIIVESFKGLAGVQEALAQIAGAQVNSTAAG